MIVFVCRVSVEHPETQWPELAVLLVCESFEGAVQQAKDAITRYAGVAHSDKFLAVAERSPQVPYHYRALAERWLIQVDIEARKVQK